MRMVWFLGLAIGVAVPAQADRPFPPVADPDVSDECGTCHVAYPPQMLPQRSWRRLMEGLADHFGEEVDLDAETRQSVLHYLLAHAADVSSHKGARKFLRGLSAGEAPLRITETPRWRKKHHELEDAVWSDARVESRANCDACHTEAEQGRFDDDHVRVPGPGDTWRRWEDD